MKTIKYILVGGSLLFLTIYGASYILQQLESKERRMREEDENEKNKVQKGVNETFDKVAREDIKVSVQDAPPSSSFARANMNSFQLSNNP